MPALDIFDNDAFTMASLTAAINKLPYQPRFLESYFTKKPSRTDTVHIEERHGTLQVIPISARGTMPNPERQPRRKVTSFKVPSFPLNQTIKADDVLNIRTFGSETELEAVSSLVSDALEQRGRDHQTTFEWHRLGAITGLILDADGSTWLDLFAAFGIAPPAAIDFTLGTASVDVKGLCTQILRQVEDAVGADLDDAAGSVDVIVGNDFWDKWINYEEVKRAYERSSENNMLREQQYRSGFSYGGINWYNYRGKVGGTNWIADDGGQVIVRDVPDLYLHHMAPADMVDTVGTAGQEMYAIQERMPFNKGIDIHTQSNALMLCTRPAVCIPVTTSN